MLPLFFPLKSFKRFQSDGIPLPPVVAGAIMTRDVMTSNGVVGKRQQSGAIWTPLPLATVDIGGHG
jgi:hypothetical protein